MIILADNEIPNPRSGRLYGIPAVSGLARGGPDGAPQSMIWEQCKVLNFHF